MKRFERAYLDRHNGTSRPTAGSVTRLDKSRRLLRRVSQAAVDRLEPRTLFAGTAVTQFHYDLQSTGVNSTETQISYGNVSGITKQYTSPVDGQIYAEPLYIPSLTTTAGNNPGLHNVVFVATEHDSLYAIDAQGGNILWKTTFQSVETPSQANGTATLLNPMGATAMTPVPSGDTNSGDLTPEIGITATPVIDQANGWIFLVADTKETIGGNTDHYVKVLYKVNIASGTIAASTVIGDTRYNGGNYIYNTSGPATNTPWVIGTGDGYQQVTAVVNGQTVTQNRVYFNAQREFGRVALTLYNNNIYMGFASHGDNGPYHGWMLSYNESLTLDGVLNTTPNGGLGGIWQGGGKIAVDPQGYFYFETGNGSFDGYNSGSSSAPVTAGLNAAGFPVNGDYADCFVKVALDPSTSVTNQNSNGWGLKISDYFAPFNNQALSSSDTDLGSGALTILPDAVGSTAHPHLLIGGGKEGKLYLLDRDNLGKFSAATDYVVQEQGSAVSGMLNTSAFFLNNPNPASPAKPSGTLLVVAGYGGGAKAFSVSNGAFSTSATSSTPTDFGYLPGSPVVSASGTSNAIVWTISRTSNVIYAYQAGNLGAELWDSSMAANNHDALGTAVKYSTPTVADGQVFVGTANALVTYGAKTPPTAPPAAPSALTATAPRFSEADLSWTDNSNNEDQFVIERSPDGSTGWTQIGSVSSNVTTYADTTALATTTYYYRVRAYNSYNGGSYSAYTNVASVTTPAAPPSGTGDGLAANYYLDNTTAAATHLWGTPVLVRTDPTINFNLNGGSPGAGVPGTNFSAEWTGSVQAPATGTYTFHTISDDGVRLWVNGTQIINDWTDHGTTDDYGTVTLVAGQTNTIVMDYYQGGGGSIIELHWSSATMADQPVTFLNGGATGKYYDDYAVGALAHLQGTPVVSRVDPTIDSTTQWPNYTPAPAVGNTNFSATWTGEVQAQFSETYTFYTKSDDGIRLWVNGQFLVDDYLTQGTTQQSGTITLSAGQKYAITVQYFQGGGPDYAQLLWSSPSTPMELIPQSQLYSGVAPAAPTNLTAVAAASVHVNLNWTDNSNIETGYIVQRQDPTTNGAFVTIATLAPNSTSYQDANLYPNTLYSYRVQATNFAANSAWSNTATLTTPVPPAKPSNAHSTAATTTSISLAWTDNSNNEDGFRVSRQIFGGTGSFIVIAQLPPDTTSYIDTGSPGPSLAPGTEYQYHVQAYNVAGYNDFAGCLTSTLTLAPTGLAVTVTGGQNSLAWTAPSFTGNSTDLTFNIYRGTTPGGEGATPIATNLFTTSFIDTTAVSGQVYYYKVTAVDPGGQSAASNEASGTPLPPPHVAAVLVSGTNWSSSFLSYLSADGLGNGGYSIPAGAGQSLTLPWNNINQVSVVFDQAVSVAQASAVIDGVNVASYGISGFSYNAANNTATWTLANPIGDDRLQIDLASSVTNASGEALNGNWVNGTSTFPSGATGGAAPFDFQFNVLPGDVNQNGFVVAADALVVRSLFSDYTASPGYSPFADINADGYILANDALMVRADFSTSLPVGSPLVVAGASATPPLKTASPTPAPLPATVAVSSKPVGNGTSATSRPPALAGASHRAKVRRKTLATPERSTHHTPKEPPLDLTLDSETLSPRSIRMDVD